MILNQISFDELFGEEKPKKSPLSSSLHKPILTLLESGVTSVMEMCDYLIKERLLSNERFSSNKPKEYPKVCFILDEMVQQGIVELVEDKDRTDRIYKLKGEV